VSVALWVLELVLALAVVAILDAWRKLRRILRELDRLRTRWEREDGFG
jgi:hypothetical protein